MKLLKGVLLRNLRLKRIRSIGSNVFNGTNERYETSYATKRRVSVRLRVVCSDASDGREEWREYEEEEVEEEEEQEHYVGDEELYGSPCGLELWRESLSKISGRRRGQRRRRGKTSACRQRILSVLRLVLSPLFWFNFIVACSLHIGKCICDPLARVAKTTLSLKYASRRVARVVTTAFQISVLACLAGILRIIRVAWTGDCVPSHQMRRSRIRKSY